MSIPHDIKAYNRAVIQEFRAHNGVLSDERLQRGKLILLTTVGAKTGREHTVPLGDFSDDDSRVVLWASAIGAPKHPAWYLNLAKNPAVVVERVGADGQVERLEATATTATGAERQQILARLGQTHPQVVAHQDQTEREIPVVVITW
ncbi:nitroreductase/quinone reductase family protein [Amycolatopsis pithecellobii]|uniref:Nitroreductase family deazaflavin-dependent oxidoreductase n=1 Tax=Amycolatopsis pithecellobii TaxID=664692 RepID=A0A6N7Z142_9PSEU|nr:nitroreductase/quinone reductase family protein [Amycolatopsis pithecellobii]MTD55093.1 nitroreductase family deazaflavin-dependent oxidoreductase [Amycolatopsis pithecellobii]